MKHINRNLAILILLLSISFPVFAQDATEVPKATDEAAVTEVVPTEVPEIPLAEPVSPNETIDEQTWVDDVLEYLASHTGEIILGIGLLIAILRMNKPMTAAEKASEAAEIARQREDARLTPEPIDDLIVSIRELIHGMRRMENALPTAQRATTASGDQQTVNVFTDDAGRSLIDPATKARIEAPNEG